MTLCQCIYWYEGESYSGLLWGRKGFKHLTVFEWALTCSTEGKGFVLIFTAAGMAGCWSTKRWDVNNPPRCRTGAVLPSDGRAGTEHSCLSQCRLLWVYPTGRINVNAGDPATGCILIENEGNIPSLFIFPLWPGSPHLSGMACSLCLGWLCLCFPHSHIAPGVSGAEDKVLILTFLQFPSLSLLLSVSAFPHLKVGAVYLAVLYKPKPPP